MDVHRRWAATALLMVGLVVGCASPPRTGAGTGHPAAPATAPASPPTGGVVVTPGGWKVLTAGVVKRPDGWEVPKLRHFPRYYLWSPDLRWVAFERDDALWAVSADGTEERLLDEGEAWRDFVGWWEGQLVFLRYLGDKTQVGLAAPDGGDARTVATLPAVETFGMAGLLDGSHLALLTRTGPAVGIDLSSGTIRDLELPGVSAWCWVPAASPAGRYALVPGLCNKGDLRVLDLQTWAVRQVDGRYPLAATWSLQGDRWAAVAGGDPEAAKRGDVFGSELAISTAAGQVETVKPPLPLKLTGGPYWSPDGKEIVVLSELKPPTDGRGRDGFYEAWLVTPETGAWKKLTSLQFSSILGWHLSQEYLVVWKVVASAGLPEVGRLSPQTGEIAWLPRVPPEQADPARLDESVAVAEAAGGFQPPAAFLPGPDGKAVPVRPGSLPFKDYLQVRPPYVSYIEYPKEGPQPTLVVQKR